ncbi:MAG: DEAD/DEAH box helicase, partial [Oxalobacteraceae bacterium]
MIPAWLLESNARLASAVDAACLVPSSSEVWRFASIPTSINWWIDTDPASYAVVGLSHDVLLLDHRQVSREDIPAGVSSLPVAPFLRIKDSGTTMRWLLVDRAAKVLDPRGGLSAFTTFPIGDVALVYAGNRQVVAQRPVLATRRHHVLHPRAEDQAGYWSEVLRTFREVAEVGGERVPLLLVGSSRSNSLFDLLTTGLAEIGIGEMRPAHRSRREHLLRASSRGFALVDSIDHWPIWKSLAESAGIVLQPVVEALPIEEWYACAEAKLASNANGASSSQRTEDSETIAIDGASLLETAPALIEASLYGWLSDVGLSPSQTAVILIDPRAGTVGKGLSHLVDLRLLTEQPLQLEQTQRLDLVLSPFKLAREEPPEGLEAMERFLVTNWQPRFGRGGNPVTEFKPSQRIAMEAICTRDANVLVSLPTGEGKSVLFQVPALCRGLRNRRLTLVISPLKALMRDQVERLREQGFSEAADYLSGDRPPHEIAEVIQGVLDHRIVLLYVAPERMRGEVFLDVLHKRLQSDAGLEHVVVDETHCVNQWGYEFRPDYFHALELLLRMCGAMDQAQPTPFLLLSATITASDRQRLQAIMSGKLGGPSSPLALLARPETFTNPLRAHIAVQPHRVRGMLHDRRNFDKVLAERLPFIEQAIDAARRNRAATGQR